MTQQRRPWGNEYADFAYFTVEIAIEQQCTSVSFDIVLTTMPSSSGEVSMAQITINEGLAWLKTLKKRHEELVSLRNDNAHRERRFYGSSADKEIVKEPVYDLVDGWWWLVDGASANHRWRGGRSLVV